MRKIALLVLLVCCYGCASSSKCVAPPWYEKVPEDIAYLYTANLGESRDQSVAVEMGRFAGRREIVRVLQNKIRDLTKSFLDLLSSGAESELKRLFTSATDGVAVGLVRAREDEKKVCQSENGTFRVYVLMKMLYNEGEVSSALVDVIKKEEELRLRFLGTQAFKDLEEKAKAYEEGHGVQ